VQFSKFKDPIQQLRPKPLAASLLKSKTQCMWKERKEPIHLALKRFALQVDFLC